MLTTPSDIRPYHLATEVFALPYLDEHIVYAPLVQAALLVNSAALGALSRIRDGAAFEPTPSETSLITLLHDVGIVALDPPAHATAARLDPRRPYLPTGCTLFLTTDCNLRCRYCYANGGDSPRMLAEKTAHAAIDLVVRNAIESDAESALFAFHGGGEPTRAGALLRSCVTRAEESCAEAGIEPTFALATNGVMSRSMREFVSAHMDSVMVSMDGAPGVHDRSRPRPDGGGSWAAARTTLRALGEAECSLGVRMTVTSENLEEMVSGVRSVLDNANVSTIHIEPLFACGRSLTTGLTPPDPARFVDLFRVARHMAACDDVDVVFSAARQGVVIHSFCDVSAPSFNVTPDGDVTACYEVSDAQDSRAEHFIFGRYDADTNGFSFDADRIAALRGLTVEAATRCDRCFCKYSCAGDCPAKRLSDSAADPLAGRCLITRRLTQDLLEESLLGTGDAAALQTLHHPGARRGFLRADSPVGGLS